MKIRDARLQIRCFALAPTEGAGGRLCQVRYCVVQVSLAVIMTPHSPSTERYDPFLGDASLKLIGVLDCFLDNNKRVRPDRGAFVPH
jgi:hypothetical protein